MFKEMELLSDNMLREWRIKYTNEYPHVYEGEYWGRQKAKKDKTKVEMWEEFKEK